MNPSPDFPRIILDQFVETQATLLEHLRFRGRNMVIDHPGQFSPADPLQNCPPEDKRVLGEAASVLIADATNPNLLTFLAEIGPWALESWLPALLDRLEDGLPIPATGGYTTDGPRQTLLYTLQRPGVSPAAQARIERVLAALKSDDPDMTP